MAAKPTYAWMDKVGGPTYPGFSVVVPCRRDGYTRVNQLPSVSSNPPTYSPTNWKSFSPSSRPHAPPSVKSSPAPSAAPSAAPITTDSRILTMTQLLAVSLVDRDCSAIASDPRSQTALQATVAAALKVTASDVLYSSCSGGLADERTEALYLRSVRVTLLVTVPLTQFPQYGNATTLFQDLQGNIRAAVAAGNCTKLLGTQARSLNATALSAATVLSTSATLTSVAYPTPTFSPFSASSSAGEVRSGSNQWMALAVGLSVGVAALVTILVVIVLRRRGASTAASFRPLRTSSSSSLASPSHWDVPGVELTNIHIGRTHSEESRE
eukprot:gene28262-31456_t